MDVSVKPGKYVVAVSGGVDSMVLLDVLASMPGLELIVAHFDHGIREDSDFDRELVERAAKHYGLPFVHERGHLGAGTSEARAREARYAFLQRVKDETGAQAITTGHHQDDALETAIINILRGTGRKGLSSLQSTDEIVRPLLHVPKRELYEYAGQHRDIMWREDSTNASDQYLRNYVRRHIIKGLGEEGRALLLEYIRRAAESNPVIDMTLLHEINTQTTDSKLNRHWFIMLPYDVSCEVMAAWLRANNIREFDRRLINRLVVTAKVALPGKKADINAGHLLEATQYGLRISAR